MRRLSHIDAIHNLINQKHAYKITDIARRIHGGGDNTLIAAQKGEYVIPKHIVDEKGKDYFDKMIGGAPQNRPVSTLSGIPHFVQGGEVGIEPSPIPGNISDAPPGGGQVQIFGGRLHNPDWSGFQDSPAESRYFNNFGGWAGYGTTPSTGLPAFGATMIPTNWVNYPGVGNVPQPVVSGDFGVNSTSAYHAGQQRHNQ